MRRFALLLALLSLLAAPAFAQTTTSLGPNTFTGPQSLNGGGTTTPEATPATTEIGYLGSPQNSQSANYTLALTDCGKQVWHPDADTTARTFTIPANASVAFPIGTTIVIINGNGAGVITLAITSDTLRYGALTGSRSIAANSVVTLMKVTSTVWYVVGGGLS